MFSFFASVAASQSAGAALRKSASWVAKKITSSSWSRILKKALRHFCTSYDWDDAQTSADSCVITNIVPRPEVVNKLLARFGLRLASEGCEIEALKIKITLKMRSDLGVFSEPWHVELSGVKLHVELGARKDEQTGLFDEWSEDSSFVTAEESSVASLEEEPSATGKGDWFPLHKALENMHLHIHNVSIHVRSSSEDTAVDSATVARAHLMMRLHELTVVTTDEQWKELVHTTSITGGGTMFKKATFRDFKVSSHTTRQATFSDAQPSLPDLSDQLAVALLPAPPMPAAVAAAHDAERILIQGVCGDVKVTKQLKTDLSGSVADNFLGQRYRIDFSLDSSGRPRFAMPSLPLVLEWDEVCGAFKTIFDGQVQASFSHIIEAPELAECTWWLRQLRDAFHAAQPSLEAQLANEKRWRTEEHTKACRLQNELTQAKEAWTAQIEASRATVQQRDDDKARMCEQAAHLARRLDDLVREVDSGVRLDPTKLIEIAQHAKLLSDPEDARAGQSSGSSQPPRLSRVGTSSYEFGDATAGTIEAVANVAKGYKFGDGMRSLGMLGGKKK